MIKKYKKKYYFFFFLCLSGLFHWDFCHYYFVNVNIYYFYCIVNQGLFKKRKLVEELAKFLKYVFYYVLTFVLNIKQFPQLYLSKPFISMSPPVLG
jgi:hypothetical protein